MWFVLRHKIFLTHSIMMFSIILWCSWKLTVQTIILVFQFLKSVFGSHFYRFLTSKVLYNFCSFWSICCNMLLSLFTKQHLGSILELPVKWLLYLPTRSFSSYTCFCTLLFEIFWINSFYCWTLKSRSRNSIRKFYCSPLYFISQVADSHLVTRR